MVCKNCGTNNSVDARFCAKCGADMSLQVNNDPYAQNQGFNQAPQGQFNMAPQPPMPGQQPAMPGKGLAIASMVCGILSIVLFCLWYIGIPLGIVGIVLGGVAKSKGCRSGMATAGIVCGAIGIALFFIFLIIGLAVIDSVTSNPFYYF